MKKYAVIPTSRFAELTSTYRVINQVTNDSGQLIGWILLEDYITAAQLAEIKALTGTVFEDATDFINWKQQFNTAEPAI